MAKQRVLVGELNAPTEVTPTARPVDTYVSPEKPIVQPSPLSQFLNAISPVTNLMQEEARKAKAQQERDELNGKRANEQHQAEMAAINLTARLKEDWITNQNNWLSLSTEEAAERVSRHYSDYRMNLDEAQINPLALQAFDQKVDQDKLLFMFNNFGPEKRKRNIEQQDQQFNDTIRRAGSVAEDDQIVPAMVDAFNQHVAVTGGDYRRANDLVIATALVESKRGRTNYLKFVDAIQTRDGKSLRSIDRYAKDFNTIDANVAASTKATSKVNKLLIKQAAVNKLVADSIATGNPAGAKIGEKVIVSDGAGGTIEILNTKELSAKAADEQFFIADQDLRNEVEALSIAKSQGRHDPATFDTVMETLQQQRVDLEARFFNTMYNPHGIVPARYKLPIAAGLPFLQGGDVSEGSQGLAALGSGLKAIRDFKSMGGSMSTLKLSKEQEFKVNALNALLESGRELRDIAPFAAKPIPQDFGRVETLVTEERVKDTIDTGYFFDNTNIDEAQIGYPSLLMDVQKQAKAIMFISEVPMSAEEAVALAIPQVRDNYLTLKTSQFDALALGDPRHFSVVKKVEGQLNSEANEKILDDILERTFDNERVKEIIEPRLTAIGSKTTGFLDPDMAFAWQQDSQNVNMLHLMAYAEGDYSNMVQVGTINLQKLTSTSSLAFANELAEELNKSVEQADVAELMSIEAQKAAEASGITLAPAPTGYISDPVSRAYDALNQSMDMSSFTPPSLITPAGASTLDNISLDLPKGVPDEMSKKFVERLVALEDFKSKPYRLRKFDGTYEKHWTVGYGHNGPDVDPNKTYTRAEAKAFLIKDLNDKIKTTLRLFPKFSSYSPELQVELIQTVFRGGIKKDHDTTELINEGRFKEAAEEFLNHKEYEAAEGSTETSGIRPRMEALRDALVKETLFKLPSDVMTKQKTKTIKDSGVPEDLDSFAFGQIFP